LEGKKLDFETENTTDFGQTEIVQKNGTIQKSIPKKMTSKLVSVERDYG
jgi:hypothetical protein